MLWTLHCYSHCHWDGVVVIVISGTLSFLVEYSHNIHRTALQMAFIWYARLSTWIYPFSSCSTCDTQRPVLWMRCGRLHHHHPHRPLRRLNHTVSFSLLRLAHTHWHTFTHTNPHSTIKWQFIRMERKGIRKCILGESGDGEEPHMTTFSSY